MLSAWPFTTESSCRQVTKQPSTYVSNLYIVLTVITSNVFGVLVEREVKTAYRRRLKVSKECVLHAGMSGRALQVDGPARAKAQLP